MVGNATQLGRQKERVWWGKWGVVGEGGVHAVGRDGAEVWGKCGRILGWIWGGLGAKWAKNESFLRERCLFS